MIEPVADQRVQTSSAPPPPLTLDGMRQFNETAWGVMSQRVRFAEGGSGGPVVEAVYYLNPAGQIVLPPLTPYLPVTFHAARSGADSRVERQWANVGHMLAADMRERGLRHAVPLPPDMQDVRPWQQARFVTNVKYTYLIDLPYDGSSMRTNIKRSISRARKNGFVCERTDNVDHLHECLLETEERQGFSEGLTVSKLRLAQDLLGNDAFRVYVCYAPDGEPASATVELHQPGAMAVGWVAGTKTAYLKDGVSQFLLRYVLDDLYEAGAAGYDFVGAGIPSVSASKAQWGPVLVPYYVVDGGGRSLVRYAKHLLAYKRATN